MKISAFLFLLTLLTLTPIHAQNTGQVWAKRFHGPAKDDDTTVDVATDAQGNVFVTGYTIKGAPNYDEDFYTVKYAAVDGRLLWECFYDGDTHENDQPVGMVVDARGDVVVAGYTINGIQTDFYTVKYSGTDGHTLWKMRYAGLEGGFDTPTAVGMDADGNVFVTGRTEGEDSDWLTIKYASADGAVLWLKTYSTPPQPGRGSYDDAEDLAVDGAGNVIVTGSAQFGGYDFYTIKYNGANGDVLWSAHQHNDDGTGTERKRVAVGAGGDVVVTGETQPYPIPANLHTIKYRGSDGALIWEKFHDTTAVETTPYGVGMDAAGNVVVAGQLNKLTGDLDPSIYTVKYASADGAVVWERLSAFQGYGATDLALDGAGNVFVTGNENTTSAAGALVEGIYTAKYAAADGVILWEAHYTGSNKGLDGQAALALLPDGGVAMTCSARNGRDDDDIHAVRYKLNGQVDALISKDNGATFLGGGVNDLAGIAQRVTVSMTQSSVAFVTVKIRNNTTELGSYKVKATPGNALIKARYRDEANKNINAALANGTYIIAKLPPGAERIFTIRLKTLDYTPGGTSSEFQVLVSATNAAAGAFFDAVKVRVTVGF